jgi:hypothetical protein
MVDTAGVLKFYVNGSREIGPLYYDAPNQIPPNYGSTLNNDQGRTIGRIAAPFYGWNTCGFLDDIRIYDRSLSSREIIQLYQLHGFSQRRNER